MYVHSEMFDMVRHQTECIETYSCNKAVERLSLLDVFDCNWTEIVAKPHSWL